MTSNINKQCLYHVHFHDYVYGRISFETTVESATMADASIQARDGITMPSYVIATSVTLLEPQYEPPMLQELVKRRPEEIYGEYVPGGSGDDGDDDRDDPLTVDDILSAIASGDAGQARERIARCPNLVSLLTDDRPVEMEAANRTGDLMSIVAHLARMTGHSTHRIWSTLRSDARAVKATGQVADRITGDPLVTRPLDPPLTPGQGSGTLVDG